MGPPASTTRYLLAMLLKSNLAASLAIIFVASTTVEAAALPAVAGAPGWKTEPVAPGAPGWRTEAGAPGWKTEPVAPGAPGWRTEA
ncbi:hypothetical protein BGZ98_010075, partial [Dissophora globulifera]